jgi:hypothetical protein
MSKSDSIEQHEALMRKENLAFAISLNAIRINLLGLLVCFCLLIYKVLEPVDFDVCKVDWLKFINISPICVSLAIDAILFFAFLIFIKPFEFLQFKAFASAGFFAYLAYCTNVDNWLAYTIPLYYVLLGLLTRRLGIFLGVVLALASWGMLGFIIWQKTT